MDLDALTDPSSSELLSERFWRRYGESAFGLLERIREDESCARLLIENATEDEKAAIEAAVKEAEEAVKGDDKDAIEAAANKITEATGPVAQKMYSAQASAAEGTDSGADQAEPAGDDVVDAEFEEVKDDKK